MTKGQELAVVTEELLHGKPKQSFGSQPLQPQPLQGLGRQMFASVAVALGSMLVGFSSAYTSPALVSMAEPNSTLSVTPSQGSWVGSLMPAAALFGGMAGGFLIEWLGRKTTILATAPPSAIAWLLIFGASNVGMLYAGRILSGFCVGVTSLSLPVYMGETIQPEVRGMLGLISTTLGNIGILLCFVLGKFLDWRYLAMMGALCSLPYGLCTMFAPETPHWYLSKGRRGDAETALRWLRGGAGADVAQELRATEQGLGKGAEAAIGLPRSVTSINLQAQAAPSDKSGLALLFTRDNMRPVGVALGLMLFQQFSGINAVIFYTVKIFQDAGSTIDEFVSTMVVGAVNLGAVVLATALIDRLGRRVLLAASAAAMALALATLGTFFYLSTCPDVDVSGFGWLPLVSFVIFVVGFSVGFGPIPWLMMGEILPPDIRGPAASLATAVNWSCTFMVTKMFADVVEGVGSHAAFWGFCAVCVGAFVFVWACVPETRGRTLADIQRRMAGRPAPQRKRRLTVSESVAGWTASMASLKPMPTGA
ncbi:facilitated trehalose transporter Tret1-2 homolog [Gryllus bimaculatus]|nr:facilitated trehalose transporter Tret1-2 homolog [Gryllus bimaculatus]